jgi:hypothetical protein
MVQPRAFLKWREDWDHRKNLKDASFCSHCVDTDDADARVIAVHNKLFMSFMPVLRALGVGLWVDLSLL